MTTLNIYIIFPNIEIEGEMLKTVGKKKLTWSIA